MNKKSGILICLLCVWGAILLLTNSCNKNDTSSPPSPEPITDIDGNVYHSVQIGTQIWMTENLKTTRFKDGTHIPNITDTAEWAGLTTPGFCWYNNNATSNKPLYGALYNWYTVNTGKLAPIGWHVPTNAEWIILEDHLLAAGYNYDNTITDNKYAKALASKSGWTSSTNVGAVGNFDFPAKRNASGFTALPGGYHKDVGGFSQVGNGGYWWSSSANFENYAFGRGIIYDYCLFFRYSYSMNYGFSVRCIKNN